MRKLLGILSFTLVFLQMGCFVTKIKPTDVPSQPPQKVRQSFTLGGLVPVSGPIGSECQDGIAYATTSYSGTDFAISLGLSVLGALSMWVTCPSGGIVSEMSPICLSTGALLIPFGWQTRTVTYACVDQPLDSIVPGYKPAHPQQKYLLPLVDEPSLREDEPEHELQQQKRVPIRRPLHPPAKSPEEPPDSSPLLQE